MSSLQLITPSTTTLPHCYINETVPNEIFLLFFKILGDARDTAICRRVCKHWKQLLKNDPLWKVFYQKEFGQDPDPKISAQMQFAAEMLKRMRLKKGMCVLAPVAPNLSFCNRTALISKPAILTGNYRFFTSSTEGSGRKLNEEGSLIIDMNSGKFQHLLIREIMENASIEKCGNWLVASYKDSTKVWNLSTNVMSVSYEKCSAPACGETIWLWKPGVTGVQLMNLSTQEIVMRIAVQAREVHAIDENLCLIVTANVNSDVQLWSYSDGPNLIGSIRAPRSLSTTPFVICDKTIVYCNPQQLDICRYDFEKALTSATYHLNIPQVNPHNAVCTMLSKGPNGTIFCAFQDGWLLLDEKTLALKANIKQAELPNGSGHPRSSIVLDNNNIMISTLSGDWFVWNWSTNNCIKLANIFEQGWGGELLRGPNGTIFYKCSSGCFQVDTQCSISTWLQQLADFFETQEMCISIMNEIRSLVNTGELSQDHIRQLESASFFDIPGLDKKVNISKKRSDLDTLLYMEYDGSKTHQALTRISNRLETRKKEEINDNLNQRFLILPSAIQEGIIGHFDKLIAPLHLQLSGEKAFLESPECIPYRSQAIHQYIATLGKPALQKPLFIRLPSKQLFKNFDLNAVAAKLLDKQIVSSKEWMALFYDESDAFMKEVGIDRDYFYSIFKTSLDLERIGMNILPFCRCQKISECLFPRTHVSLNALQSHLEPLIEYIEDADEKLISKKLLNNLKEILDLSSLSYHDCNTLPYALDSFKSSECKRQEFILKKHLENLPETVAPRLRNKETVSALEYLMVLGINNPTDLSQELSIRPEFLQQIGISSSHDLQVIGLQFDLIDQMEQMSAILEKFSGENNWLETVGDLPTALSSLIKNAKESINFVEKNAVSLQGCDLEKYRTKLKDLQSYLDSFADDKKNPGSLSSWTVYCKSVLQELHEFEILREKDLLRAYCLQPGILKTWETLGRNLTLSTLKSSPENVFNMGS